MFSILGFLGGTLALHFFPYLPSLKEAFPLLGIVLITSVSYGLLVFSHKPLPHTKTILRFLLFFALGFLWILWRSHLLLDWHLPTAVEKQDLTITGTVVTLPIEKHKALRFDFKVKIIKDRARSIPGTPILRLHWYNKAPLLLPGDEWQLTVRLSRPHGMANPGTMDYEKDLFQNHIRATGYVRENKEHRLLSRNPWNAPVEYARFKLRAQLKETLTTLPYAPILTALTMGDASRISQETWTVMRKTGTIHLISISGLHITLVHLIVFFLASLLWSFWSRGSQIIAPITFAALLASLSAFVYSALAGFAIPTVRSLIMLASFMLALLIKRHTSIWQAFYLALFCVLIADPLSTLNVGFWLSFGTIALILYTTTFRLNPKGLWWKGMRLPVLLAIGLAPLSILFFQQWSLVSPLANFIAIPWVSFGVIPPALLGSLLLWCGPIGEWLLEIAHFSFKLLWPILETASGAYGAAWSHALPSPMSLACALFGIGILLSPFSFQGKALGIIYCLPLWFTSPAKPSPEELWLTMLDVGQGLAVVIETHNRTVIYDTGPRYGSGFNAGDAVLVPFLRRRGIHHIDTLVVSHSDLDHMGGTQALTTAFPPKTVLSGAPKAVPWKGAKPCIRGQSWKWDHATFTFLHPKADTVYSDNNVSCVLSVEWGGNRILLTGDIEKKVEEELVVFYTEGLRSTLLGVPHHGSLSSSTEVFIQHVHPKIALISAGYQNQFHFPKPKIVDRYQAIQAHIYNTAYEGAIQFKLKRGETSLPPPLLYRKLAHRFWWE
ncbi:MAG: DNA internalization-related competence protein ComEC/Rec2 [Gammaproteobacteria bacterium]|nr:DNA internalization-related competence protein ComEC/Rec2 [Gammaproteobacteria bacterium]